MKVTKKTMIQEACTSAQEAKGDYRQERDEKNVAATFFFPIDRRMKMNP